MISNFDDILNEIEFSTSLSGGAGGQHVNKTETKVNLKWKVSESQFFNDNKINQITKRLNNRINNEGEFRLSCSETRSQYRNKKILIQRFQNILSGALTQTKPRKATKVPKKAKLKRLKNKAINAEKKKLRKNPEI